MDWAHVMRRATQVDQKRAVLFGCFLAASFLHVLLPEQIRRSLNSDTSLGARAGLVRGRLFRQGQSLPGFREWLAYVQVIGNDSGEISPELGLKSMWRYISAIIVPENEERLEFQVPRLLSVLHYVRRPVRLFRRHGAALFERLR
jgi:hypothetical protein